MVSAPQRSEDATSIVKFTGNEILVNVDWPMQQTRRSPGTWLEVGGDIIHPVRVGLLKFRLETPELPVGSRLLDTIRFAYDREVGEIYYEITDPYQSVVDNVLGLLRDQLKPLYEAKLPSINKFVRGDRKRLNSPFTNSFHVTLQHLRLMGMLVRDCGNVEMSAYQSRRKRDIEADIARAEAAIALARLITETRMSSMLADRASRLCKIVLPEKDVRTEHEATVLLDQSLLDYVQGDGGMHPAQAQIEAARLVIDYLGSQGIYTHLTGDESIRATSDIKGKALVAPFLVTAKSRVNYTTLPLNADPKPIRVRKDGVVYENSYDHVLLAAVRGGPRLQMAKVSESYANRSSSLETQVVKRVIYDLDFLGIKRTTDELLLEARTGQDEMIGLSYEDGVFFANETAALLVGKEINTRGDGIVTLGSGPKRTKIDRNGQVSMKFHRVRKATVEDTTIKVEVKDGLTRITLFLTLDVTHQYQVGDKGTFPVHGGKMVAMVVPDTEMPCLKDGRLVDIMIDERKLLKVKGGVPKLPWALELINEISDKTGRIFEFGQVPHFLRQKSLDDALKVIKQDYGVEVLDPRQVVTVGGQELKAIVLTVQHTRSLAHVAGTMTGHARIKDQVVSLLQSDSPTERWMGTRLVERVMPLLDVARRCLAQDYKVKCKSGEWVATSKDGREWHPIPVTRPLRCVGDIKERMEIYPEAMQTNGFEVDKECRWIKAGRKRSGNPLTLGMPADVEPGWYETIMDPDARIRGAVIFQTTRQGAVRESRIIKGLTGNMSLDGQGSKIMSTYLLLEPEIVQFVQDTIDSDWFLEGVGPVLAMSQILRLVNDLARQALYPPMDKGQKVADVYGFTFSDSTRVQNSALTSISEDLFGLITKTTVSTRNGDVIKTDVTAGELTKRLPGLVYKTVNHGCRGYRTVIMVDPRVPRGHVAYNSRLLRGFKGLSANMPEEQAIRSAERRGKFHVLEGDVVLAHRDPRPAVWGSRLALIVTAADWVPYGPDPMFNPDDVEVGMYGDCDGDNAGIVRLKDWVAYATQSEETTPLSIVSQMIEEEKISKALAKELDPRRLHIVESDPHMHSFTDEELEKLWVDYTPLQKLLDGERNEETLKFIAFDHHSDLGSAKAAFAAYALKVGIGPAATLCHKLGLAGIRLPFLMNAVHEAAIDKTMQENGLAWEIRRFLEGDPELFRVDGDPTRPSDEAERMVEKTFPDLFAPQIAEMAIELGKHECHLIRDNLDKVIGVDPVSANIGLRRVKSDHAMTEFVTSILAKKTPALVKVEMEKLGGSH